MEINTFEYCYRVFNDRRIRCNIYAYQLNKIANESDVEKISSLAKTKRTVGFVCAGTSVIGIVVVLTGLHKEYAQGIEIGHNLTVSDYGAGISLTKKF